MLALCTGGCASGPVPPYPAFVDTSQLPDIFVASLPGVRAKQLAGNPETRRSSTVMSLPSGWEFTTGGFPDKSVEIYVLLGSLRLGDIEMTAGGYAFLPSGTAGLPLRTEGGARVLYFIDDAKPDRVIETPLVTNRDLVAWKSPDSVEGFGIAEKVLREDPGSGARTWLLRIEPGAVLPWQKATVAEEGFLVEGSYRHAECVAGESVVGVYASGGYFSRPPEAVNGGPESGADTPSVWYLRRQGSGESIEVAGCPVAGELSP